MYEIVCFFYFPATFNPLEPNQRPMRIQDLDQHYNQCGFRSLVLMSGNLHRQAHTMKPFAYVSFFEFTLAFNSI